MATQMRSSAERQLREIAIEIGAGEWRATESFTVFLARLLQKIANLESPRRQQFEAVAHNLVWEFDQPMAS